jgi:hypothetical protein
MKREIAKQWVEALRSGEYEQGREVLCRLDNGSSKFCCLGVLCEVARKSGLKIETKEVETASGIILQYDTRYGFLPERVRKFAGMDSTNGRIFLKDHGGISSLAKLNDRKNLSFEEIAKIIENKWGEL